jgi:hypothetical protein
MDNQNLLKRIEVLEKWKADREKQQIVFPLDNQSQIILNKYFASIGFIQFDAGAGGNPFRLMLATQNGRTEAVEAYSSLMRYSADTTADTLLIGQDVVNLTQGSFVDGQQVLLLSSDTFPSPLDSTTSYYVVNSSSGGTVIQLSLTFGGAAINITTGGVGTQYIYPLT